MKDGIILLIVILTAACLFFWGMKMVFSRSIKAAPDVEINEDYLQMIRDQRIRSQETQERQEQLMRDQKQRIKDLQRH